MTSLKFATVQRYDIVLTAHFKDRDELNIYANHENHLPIVKIIRSLCSSSVVVDYEVN